MKRFVTLLTVSITMAAIAFADHPMQDPDYGTDTGFPFHPGAWVSTTFDAGDVWQECFCLPTVSYSVITSDISVPIRVFNTMRMTGGQATECQYTMIQNETYRTWYQPGTANSFELDFYFAAQMVQSASEGLTFFVTPQLLQSHTDLGLAELSVQIRNDGSQILMGLYDANGLVVENPLNNGTPDYRFYLTRVGYEYNEIDNTADVTVRVFDFSDDPAGHGITVIDAQPVAPVNDGYFGFAAAACPISGMAPYQYIDDICMSFGYTPTADAVVSESSFELSQNYPNPFNPTTTISFATQQTSVVSLKVYDLAGSLVETLVDGLVEQGQHEVIFNGSELASGVYFYTLESEGQINTQKMVLVK